MKIEIDKKSGFCFGVTCAIQKAENELKSGERLYCLGDIVHNDREIDRLERTGLVTISRSRYFTLKDCKVLIRAHGEPPETYAYAEQNNITLIDATCPVVLKLQHRVKASYRNITREGGQLVIFGKTGHAETEGINGQTGNNAIIIQNKEELDKIDFTRPVELYSQTTMPIDLFGEVSDMIRQRAVDAGKVRIHDTVCRQVVNREPHLKNFVRRFDIVIFVSGKKSSNGAALYKTCLEANPRTYFVENSGELNQEWFEGAHTTGICGATSTPMWLMEQVARWIEEHIS
jgi:4-hydroxy-3-methylbut-2-en-1-yl diphosphate reductase